MKVFFLILMISLGKAADPLSMPLQIPDSFRPYGELIEKLYTTKGLTFEGACDMVEPFANELYILQDDPQTPQILFLLGQKNIFEAEAEKQKSLWDKDIENKFLEQSWFLMWMTSQLYESQCFKRGDFTTLNSCHATSRFFETFPTSMTDMSVYPLHIHKLLFLMYISDFLASISGITYNEVGFLKDEDYARPFLEIFDPFLKKTTLIKCGNKLFEHALWILRNHVTYIGKQE